MGRKLLYVATALYVSTAMAEPVNQMQNVQPTVRSNSGDIHVTKLIQTTKSSALNMEEQNDVIQYYLQMKTWSPNLRYDAAHHLMVPLHFAYENNNTELKQLFDEHMQEFAKLGLSDTSIRQQFLSTIQYQFMLSRYLALSNNKQSEIAPYLLQQLNLAWNDPKFNLKKSLAWKLQASRNLGYKQAITDPEWYVFAIASDLSHFYPNNSLIQDIQRTANLAFRQRTSYSNTGGWEFDLGSWDNHPDMQYIGYSSLSSISVPKPIKGSSLDSSHFFRMPLILKSLQEGAINVSDAESYEKMRLGLEKQFFFFFLVQNGTGIKLNNFMDGRNGVYRWGYHGDGKGIAPYGLTNSFGIGWWGFLPGKRIKATYRNYYEQLLEENSKRPAVGKLKLQILSKDKSNIQFSPTLLVLMWEVDSTLASQL